MYAIQAIGLKRGDGTLFQQQVVDLSGVGAGPFVPLTMLATADGTARLDIGALLQAIADAVDDGAAVLPTNAATEASLAAVLARLNTGIVSTGTAYQASGKAAVTGSFGATGRSASFAPLAGRPFNLSVWGTFAGTVILDRSFDGGTIWLPVTAAGVSLYSFASPVSEQVEESEAGVLYSLRCSAFSSGAINYRVSQ